LSGGTDQAKSILFDENSTAVTLYEFARSSQMGEGAGRHDLARLRSGRVILAKSRFSLPNYAKRRS
jgi:hypothetical protein